MQVIVLFAGTQWPGIIPGKVTRGMLVSDHGILCPGMRVLLDFTMVYGTVVSARVVMGSMIDGGSILVTWIFVPVFSGVLGPLLSLGGVVSRQSLRVSFPAL